MSVDHTITACPSAEERYISFLSVSFGFLKFFIFAAEAFDPAGGVDQFLLTGEKWMAFRANLDPDIFFGRADFHHVAAGTFDCCLKVVRMYIVFHCNFNPL